ncbi:hypothetical protein COAQ111491_17685 [Comamonas aquatilis]
MHAPTNVCMPEPAINAKCVNDAERPATSRVRKHLTPQPVVVISQTITYRLRILKKFFLIQLAGPQYHACTFLHIF